MSYQGPVGQEHTLGLAGGAGGIDQDGRMVGVSGGPSKMGIGGL